MEIINLKCEKCGCEYEKPAVFLQYALNSKYSPLYKWSLKYCNICRRERERDALNSLPYVIEKLGEMTAEEKS